MALVNAFLISSGFFLTMTLGQDPSFVAFQESTNCKDGSNPNDRTPEYFNAVTLSCLKCEANNTVQQKSANGLTCECRPGYRYVRNFGGSQVVCAPCSGAVSDDGWECVSCPGNASSSCKKSEVCVQDSQIAALRQLDGSYVSPGPTVTCLTCSADTQANTDNDRCERCSLTLSVRPTTAAQTCTCASTERKLKGMCIPTASLPTQADSFYRIRLGNSDQVSNYLQQNVEADFALCQVYRSIDACQSLANMCVLVMYSGMDDLPSSVPTTPCSLLLQVTDTSSNIRPQIIVGIDADKAIINSDIKTQWSFDPVMKFPFQVGQFSLDGQFEGYKAITGGLIQLCQASDNILDAAYTFGTYYSHTCSISAISLWDQTKFPLKFYEVYLEYQDTSNVKNLYRIPNKIVNFIGKDGQVNLGPMRDWKLTRRFFLVDNTATRTQADTDAPNIRYAKNIHLAIQLQDGSADGRINVPYFEIEYDYISRELALTGSSVKVSFTVTYTMSQSSFTRSFQIATGVLSSLAILYAGFRTYVWSRRAGRLTIDFPTLANLIFYLCGALANVFFVVVFGTAFYLFVFYKRQNVFYIAHLEGQAYEDWVALFGAAFALKALAVIHMIIMQSSADIFLIDWERPKGQSDHMIGDTEKDPAKKPGSTVSIWRTYFVANEWNEIQTKRKINKVFQIFAVLFFLVVLGFEDTTTKDADGSVNKGSDVYRSDESPVYRMALAALVYLLVAVVQAIFFVFVYERFITDDIREFVDLCSMSNVSMFIMAHGEFGYYIHGRSVHGRSDVNLREMFEMFGREEKNLVGQRGLVPNTEPQTFIMAVPKRLRQKYETVYMPVQLENASAATRAGQGKAKEQSIEAYGTLNRFLCAFIDHSLRDIDYVVKEKNFLEKILDTEFLELTDKGILYNDNGHSFDNILFYGNEFMLIIFDTLLFCIVDLIFSDYVLAGIVTYIITELLCLIRDTAGRKNLVKKTLVDERFLI